MPILNDIQRTLELIRLAREGAGRINEFDKEHFNVLPRIRSGIDSLRGKLDDRLNPQIPYARKTNQPSLTGLSEANPGAGVSGLGSLYDQLLGMLTGPISVDRDAIMRDIRAQLDPIFDERIAQAEKTAGRGKQDITSMYSALAKDYERLAPEQAAQAQEAQEDVGQLYNELKTTVEGNYTKIAGQEADLYAKLGIESAAPDVLNPLGEQAAKSMSRADELGAINEQRYMDIADIDETYYRKGSPLATLTGANRSSDLLQQLQDYVSATEAERSAGINQAFSQAYSSAQGAAQQQASQQQGMLFDILQQQLQGGEQQELTPDSFMASLHPQIQAEAGAALRSLERSQSAITGRQELTGSPVPGTFVPLTAEWWLNQVDDMYAKGQISDASRQALIMYLRLRDA
jgi:hypothetical protein